MINEQGDTVTSPSSLSTQSRVILQPIAAPSILGLYGLAGATFMVAAHMVHWFGSTHTVLLMVPFAVIFGGLVQFLAGMWAYKARDGVATAVHGMWGAFWMAFGVLSVMLSSGRMLSLIASGGGTPPPAGIMYPELGLWFSVLAAVTWVCTFAASAENAALVTMLTFLSAASTITAIGLLLGIEGLMVASGYLFIIASIAAWYTASALMLNEAFGHRIWKLGRSAVVQRMQPVTPGIGEPGVIRGQV